MINYQMLLMWLDVSTLIFCINSIHPSVYRDRLENLAHLDPQVLQAPLQPLWMTFLEHTSTLMLNTSQRNLHLPRQSSTRMRQGPIRVLMRFGSTVTYTCLWRAWEVSWTACAVLMALANILPARVRTWSSAILWRRAVSETNRHVV